MSRKFALIIGNTEYTDPGLAQLTAPGKDAEDFGGVLKNKDFCEFDEVRILLNQISSAVIEAVDEFFDQRKPDDLLILYFSGHGVRDELGSLYLAVKNTIRSRLRSTAIKSDYIREAMDQSRSKRQVLILDCCNSGAFPQGTKAATGLSIGTSSVFEAGYGRVILTASDSTQFAWEGNKVIGETDNSLFTHFLVQGLEGEADLDGDGRITVDELYDYTYEKVKLATPKQTPSKFSSKQQGEILLRQIMRIEDIKPLSLPADLMDEIEDSRPYVREAVVQKLEKILKGRNIGMARSAMAALEKIIEDENTTRRVVNLAEQALATAQQVKPVEKESDLEEAADVTSRRVEPQPLVNARAIEAGVPSEEKRQVQAKENVQEEVHRVVEKAMADLPSMIPPSNKSPIVAALLSFVLFGGLGQIYVGQIKKGIALIVAILGTIFIFIGVFLYIASAFDAYAIAKKMRAGYSVGEWEFAIDWKGLLISCAVTIVLAIAIVAMYLLLR